MLRADLQDELDAKLCDLLTEFQSMVRFDELAAKTRRILEAYEHEPEKFAHQQDLKLLRPGWQRQWEGDVHKSREVPDPWLFGRVDRDRVAHSLWKLFVEFIRFILKSPTPFQQDVNRRRVVAKLCDFLSRREIEVTTSTATDDAARQGEGEQTAKSHTAPNRPKPSELLAWSQRQAAIKRNAELNGATDDDIYAWLAENGEDNDRLPRRDTWKRQLRGARRAAGTQKNQPRAGREHGRSIARRKDL